MPDARPTYQLDLVNLVDLESEYNGSHHDWTHEGDPEAWTSAQVTARVARIRELLATWTADCLPGWDFRDGTFTIPDGTDRAANREKALLLVIGMVINSEAKPTA